LASTAAGAVFLSYASEDAEAAQTICHALRAAGIEVWFDQSELRGGDAWDRRIREKIHECRLFVPVISAHTEQRDEGYFRREWKLAVDRTHDMSEKKTFLVPVVVDDTRERGAAVPDKFHDIQWTRLPAGEPAATFVSRVAGLLRQTDHGTSTDEAHAGVPAGAKPDASRARWLLIVATAVAVIVVVSSAYVGYERLSRSKRVATSQAVPSSAVEPAATTPTGEKSIAVLPFVNMSPDKDQEYFADGLAEELLDQLAKTPGLKVIARTSSFYFKGKQATVTDIGRTLHVANVLEGSVRKSGNRLRVSTQLVSTASGEHLWSETYDRELKDVFKLQDEIAGAVVQSLRLNLAGSPANPQTAPTRDLDAYQLYLRAKVALDKNNRSSIAAAERYGAQAIKLDPKFALARLAAAYAALAQADNSFVPPQVGYERGRQLALQALALDPSLAEAHAILGYVHRVFDWDWSAADAELQTALGSDPSNAQALQFAGLLAYTLGQWDDSLRQLRASAAINPLDTYTMWNIGTALYLAGRYQESERSYRTLLDFEPNFSWTHSYLAKTLLALGRPDEALAMARQEPEESNRLDILPIALDGAGRRVEADKALATLATRYGDTDAYFVAMTYASRGETDRALEWLDRAYRQHENGLVEITGERLFKKLAGDSRYKAFLRKMNLPE
jgi:TolB-like protein/Flp pilus assembly protein TadD